jgi:molybdopterin synthase sulfurtransferase
MYREITTEKLQLLLKEEDIVLIDSRPTAAYNGWTLHNEPRGGHIPGSRTLPAAWAEFIDWIEIVRHKGIEVHQHIVVYGYQNDETEKVADRFKGAGYENISIYRHFTNEWCLDENLPLLRMKRFKSLVYPDWLQRVIKGESAPHYQNGSNYVICHAHYRNYEDYLEGHIPGAIALNTLALEAPETWNRRSPAELKAALEAHGITSDTTVILYGRFSYPDNNDPFPGSAAGHLGAIRCAAIMMYAGVKDVRILNGGIASWEAENLPLSQQTHEPRKVEDFGAAIPAQPGLFVDLDEARQLLEAADGDLVCTRSWPEYIGEVSGYNYIEKKGRIPGVLYVNNGSDAYRMENYQNLDFTTREYHEIIEMWEKAGVTPDKHLAFYCGTGWRGSEAFYNAWLLGWPRVSVYDGGWFEWSNEPGNPIETGVPDYQRMEAGDSIG